MSKSRVLAAALLFLAATCIKFALPARGERLSAGLYALMEQGLELRQAAAYLGKSVAAFQFPAQEAVEADTLAQEAETEHEALPEQTESIPDKAPAKPVPALFFQTPIQTISLQVCGQTPSPEAVESCAAELAEKERMEKLSSDFLTAQSVFSGCKIPENVCCAAPELGIAYTSPICGMRSSGFGYRVHPVTGEVKFHYGTDFAACTGTEIGCFADGTVAMTGEESGYGNYVIVNHGNCSSLYAHCSKILVSARDAVRAGQAIALVGETGLVTGPHLHFELRQDGTYLNPEFYCGGEG